MMITKEKINYLLPVMFRQFQKKIVGNFFLKIEKNMAKPKHKKLHVDSHIRSCEPEFNECFVDVTPR